MNSTTYAKRTNYKPIDFFFRGIIDCKGKEKKVSFVDAFQILNDRYLGRMSTQNYFAIAESSVRINELNIIALDELKNYDLVFRENFLIPDVTYFLPVSTRFLENDKDFLILLETLKDSGYKKSGLVIEFFASSLVNIDEESQKRYAKLKKAGYKICVAQFGDEFNSLDLFSFFNFDYLRCEASYFDTAKNKKQVLSMLVSYCRSNKIDLIMEGVDTPAQYQRFKREGVRYLTGKGCSKLVRFVTNEFLLLKDPQGKDLEKYMEKLNKDLSDQEKKELKELARLRQAAIDRLLAASDGEHIMPLAPRPELAKSPYQVRLDQQRNMAKKAQDDRIAQLTKGAAPRISEKDEAKLIDQMKPMRFEGDVTSALALSFASDLKSELRGIDTVKKPSGEEAEPEKEIKKDFMTKEESGIDAPSQPDMEAELAYKEEAEKKSKKKKNIRADREKEQKLLAEYSMGGMFDALGQSSAMRGFGVKLHIKNKEEGEEDIVGSLNEKGQWTDEEGNTFNGYFDENSNWVEYEQFDKDKEGHYNENYQWVDKDGNVYDGYYDEEGRWIDYSYSTEDGEIVDNGYFDDKLKKWVPFGYFDETGTYHKF